MSRRRSAMILPFLLLAVLLMARTRPRAGLVQALLTGLPFGASILLVVMQLFVVVVYTAGLMGTAERYARDVGPYVLIRSRATHRVVLTIALKVLQYTAMFEGTLLLLAGLVAAWQHQGSRDLATVALWLAVHALTLAFIGAVQATVELLADARFGLAAALGGWSLATVVADNVQAWAPHSWLNLLNPVNWGAAERLRVLDVPSAWLAVAVLGGLCLAVAGTALLLARRKDWV